jgi:hypothetical protein
VVRGKGRRWGAGGRNDPNNVCTYKYMNKEKKVKLTKRKKVIYSYYVSIR